MLATRSFSTGKRYRRITLGLLAALACHFGLAQESHHQHGDVGMMQPPPFVASTAKSFAQLTEDAMAVMDYGMRNAVMTGNAEHDFVTMMIPHHQGAIDMAKALLLTTSDPALRNLAQQVVADQQIEIQLMQAWLKAHASTPATQSATPQKSLSK